MFVACDESGILGSDNYLIIGSAWISKENLIELERRVTELRIRHKCWGEVEWLKTSSMSPAIMDFYKAFIDLAFQGDIPISLRFIVVKKSVLEMDIYHSKSDELVRFKFMHLLLSRHASRFLTTVGKRALHIVYDSFSISKKAQAAQWAPKMRAHIERHLGGTIEHIQPCTSHICSLIQICDLITGAISSSWNNSPSKIGPQKQELIDYFEKKIGHGLRVSTLPTEDKFNIWVWRPSPRVI